MKSRSGGTATQSGILFQNRVAAWMATRILAEKDVSPLWGLPSHITFEFLRCETEQPVDDLMVGTSDSGHIFIQVKHRVNLESTADSPLASAIDQFVRQYLTYHDGVSSSARAWERPLETARDRLVLVTGPASSTPIRELLRKALARLRSSAPDQSIDYAAIPAEERKILGVILDHIRRSWRSQMGDELPDTDAREILNLLRVEIIDVDEEGTAEREAKDLLRRTVLKEPAGADTAWSTLIEACGYYARTRNGADRAELQQRLLTAGISLVVPRSYRDDIERLRRYSLATMRALSDLSKFRIGAKEVRIKRPSTLALRTLAETESVVVVGEPGAGKSGALHDTVETLLEEGRDVVFFAVDRLEARSLGALREELGLTHDLDDILRNWPGQEPAFLVTDALDAARSEPAAQTFRSLLADTIAQSSRWRVIASIRKFDLRHDTHIRRLFTGRPQSEFRDMEFWDVNHFNVPLLSPQELAYACEQSSELSSLVTALRVSNRQELLSLLASPFNLRLVGELLGAGVAVESLSPITTQIGLLDRYWNERVIRSDSQGDAREVLLRRSAEKMVERRSLRVDRADIVSDGGSSAALKDLQSAHVLLDWQPSPDVAPDRYVLTFAHHLLFDYAVANLLLRGDPRKLFDRLEKDPELVVAIRPSIVFHFQHEWLRDQKRNSFWDLAFLLISSSAIPEVGKLIGPSVAAELTSSLSDCQPLLTSLQNGEAARHKLGIQALRYLTGALLATLGSTGKPLIGPSAPPWCDLLEQCTRPIAPVAYTIRPLLMTICDHQEELTDHQLISIGLVARRLLEYAWLQDPPDQWLIVHGIQAVCRTFESDAVESVALLRRCLESEHLASYGYIEMPVLADEVRRLIAFDPQLVEEVYLAAFTYREYSEEKTPLGGSRILPLSSNRAQDYQMALWALAETYPEFIDGAPLNATRVLVAALDTYVKQRRRTRLLDDSRSEQIDEEFDFNGRKALYRADHSEIWDSGGAYRDEEPLKMLNAFTQYLNRIGEDAERVNERLAIINIIVDQNRYAVLWRQLLKCGAAVPETIGREIRFLAWAMPILTNFDTSQAVGDYLKKTFRFLNLEDRERIECAILSIPSIADEDGKRAATRTRDRLLGCLQTESVVTEEAKEIIHQFEAQGGAPPNESFSGISVEWGGPVTDEDYLAKQGVPVDEEPNRRIREIARPVQEFASKYHNSAPTLQEIEEILPALLSLRDVLLLNGDSGVHPKQKDMAWAYLIEACEAIAGAKDLTCIEGAGSLARGVLLEGSTHPDPTHTPENDASFDEHQGWGIPAPRVDAARGVIRLARLEACADETILDCVERLSHDDVPAVRFQIATHLNALYKTAPDLMWRIAERMSDEEKSRGVLLGLLAGPMERLAGPHADRVAELVKTIFDRVTEGSGAQDVRRICISIFAQLYVWRDQPLSHEVVFEIASNPSKFTDEAHRIIFRDLLTLGPVDPPNAKEDETRHRAFALVERALRSTCDALNELESRNKDTAFAEWPAPEQEEFRRLVQLADSVASELYFASGAFKNEQSPDNQSRPPIGPAEKLRFLREVGPLFDRLANLGIATIAHHLVKTLEYLVEHDPADVFVRIGRVVRASKAGNYQYESLAVDRIVRLVNRYLAEYRHVLRENEECRRALIDILDIFVQASWPSALQLAYRMEEMYR